MKGNRSAGVLDSETQNADYARSRLRFLFSGRGFDSRRLHHLLIQQNSTQYKNPLEIAGFLLSTMQESAILSIEMWGLWGAFCGVTAETQETVTPQRRQKAMSKAAIQLSVTRVKNAKARPKEYKLFDGGGLYLLGINTGASNTASMGWKVGSALASTLKSA